MSFSDLFNEFVRPEYDVNGIARRPKPGQDMPLFDSFSNKEEAQKIANIINKHLNFEHDKAYVKESVIHPGTFKVFSKSVSEDEIKSNALFQGRIEKMKSEITLNLRKNKLKEIVERTKNFPDTIPPDFFHNNQLEIRKIEDDIRLLANQTPEDSWTNTPITYDNLRKLDSEEIKALEKLIDVVRQFPMRDEFDESTLKPIIQWKQIIDDFKVVRQKVNYVDDQLKSAGGGTVEQSISEIVGDYLHEEKSNNESNPTARNLFSDFNAIRDNFLREDDIKNE